MIPQRLLVAVLVTATIGTAGWSELPCVPHGTGCRCVKDGGWLVYDSVTARLYAAKGNKTFDFLAYDPLADTWSKRTDCPAGSECKPVCRGAAGCVTDNGVIYATKGNNTAGFHRYHTTANAWQQMPDVPLGSQAKKCKGGTDVAYVPGGGSGYVYLLKGRVRDFLRFDIAAQRWEAMPDAPVGNMFKWDKGSWLAYDGAGTIYAHKAKIHELHRFDVASGQWVAQVLVGMPFYSGKTGMSKKSRDGSAAAFIDGRLYALKGGNTPELWRFDPATMAWTELDPLPLVGASGKRRRVKAGGHLATDGSVLYALKGAKTNEFWRYTPGALDAEPGGPVRRDPSECGQGRPLARELTISPNPAHGPVVLSWPNSGADERFELAVYDPTGRTVCRVPRAAGPSIRFDATSLPAGAYIIYLTGPARTLAGRLVVE